MYKGYRIRLVRHRIDLSRFHALDCWESDHTLVFDCTAVPPAIVEAYINRYMILKQLTDLYRIQRSKLRPGYVYVHFTMRDGEYVKKANQRNLGVSSGNSNHLPHDVDSVQLAFNSLSMTEVNVTINDF